MMAFSKMENTTFDGEFKDCSTTVIKSTVCVYVCVCVCMCVCFSQLSTPNHGIYCPLSNIFVEATV